MERLAKLLCFLGGIWVPVSLATSYYLLRLPIWRGGLMDTDRDASYESQMDWDGRLLDGFLSLGLLGTLFLVLGAIFYLLSMLIRKSTARAAQA